MGLVVPGFVPDVLGEIYEYTPTMQEILVTVGIWASGAMIYTFLLKFAVPVYTGQLRFYKRTQGITAADVMTRKLVTASPGTSVEELGKLLIAKRISSLPVIDSEDRVLGIVSESDVLFQEMGQLPEFSERLGDLVLPDAKKGMKQGDIASEIMTSPVVTANEETPLKDLSQIMSEKGVKRLVIVDSEGHAVGIVSRADILRTLENLRESRAGT